MSYTIITQPDEYSPVYNQIYATVTSSNNSQCSFKYICDVYVEGALVARLKQLPDLSGRGEFRVNRVLEDYVTSEPKFNVSGIERAAGQMIAYELEFGEEYDTSTNCDNSSIVPTYNIDNTGTLYAWNAALDYVEFKSFDINDYIPTDETTKFLTYQPTEVLIDLAGEAELYFICENATDVAQVEIVTYDSSTDVDTVYIPFTVASPFTSDDMIQAIGIGPMNLNDYFNTNLISKDIVFYTIQLQTSGGSNRSELITYTLDKRPTINDTKYRFRWLNKLGGYDSYTFTLNSNVNTNIAKTEINKLLNNNYNIGDRGRMVTSVKANDSVTTTSNWLTDEENEWIESLYISPDVSIQLSRPIYCFNSVNGILSGNAYLVTGKPIKEGVDVTAVYMVDTNNINYSGGQYLDTYNGIANGYEVVGATFTSSDSGVFYLRDYISYNIPIVITNTTFTEKVRYKTKNINHTVAFDYAFDKTIQRN